MTSVPAIPGFYPDPSICRVGDTFYVANSSFEYRPGVPIHASTDLVNWSFVANALVRESQLPDSAGTGSSGIFAPTLRHHDGLLWLITTDVVDGMPEQSIQHATDPRAPWSDPVRTRGAVGIDPDLAWDGDDCYLTWARFDAAHSFIAQAQIDPFTGLLKEEPRRLWSGTGLAFPEGPHIFRRAGWWYLLIAEGGTERGHAVSIARGLSPRGPFFGAPSNPILSHRSLAHPVQNTGHADLVEAADGSWAMVYLGVRPRGTSPGFHVNGRETFIAGVDWVDDWPVVSEDRFDPVEVDTTFVDTFDQPEIDGRWISPGVFPSTIAETSAEGLVISSEDARFVGIRARDEFWSAQAEVTRIAGTVALEVRMDADNRYAVELTDDRVSGVVYIGGGRIELESRPLPTAPRVRLRIRTLPVPTDSFTRSGPDLVELSVATDTGQVVLGETDGRYLSTEVTGGFTGRVVGMALAPGSAVVHSFQYGPSADRGE